MSQYSAQILICFIAYIFIFFNSSMGFAGNLEDCNHAHWPFKTLSGIYANGQVKLTDKMDEICINGKLSVQEPS